MFPELNADTLSQLWSGAIGSFIAAIIGGVVAWMIVRMTNGHQTRIAELGREREAAADLVAASQSLIKTYPEGKMAVRDAMVRAHSAAFRWAMATQHDGAADEIRRWPHHLGLRGLETVKAGPLTSREDSDAAFDRLNESVSYLYAFALHWPKARRRERNRLVAELREARLNTLPKPKEAEGMG